MWLIGTVIIIFRIFFYTFWVFDILNMPFMEIFDTTYPINTLAWILLWLLLGDIKFEYTRSKGED